MLDITGDPLALDMADTVVHYSKDEVVAAGKALKGTLAYTGGQIDEQTLRVFRVAHAWRTAHIVPMRKVRSELLWANRRLGVEAITAARLKRMQSIRKKLRKTPLSLYQIQDIGGCRAIVGSMADFERLRDLYRNGHSRHRLQREDDYITSPRMTGYRGHHLRLKFNGEGDDSVYNRQFIEVQLRTRLQHAWATAVEAVGLVRREDLKGNDGDADWLRLFALMGSEFAVIEDRPLVPDAPKEKNRRQELRHLEQKLNATACLDRWNRAIQYTEQIDASASGFYLIQFDSEKMEVTVQPGSARLLFAEEKKVTKDTVLVELERAEDLKTAYPNYFLDVALFNNCLAAIVSDQALPSLDAPMRRRTAPAKPGSDYKVDLSWWRWPRA